MPPRVPASASPHLSRPFPTSSIRGEHARRGSNRRNLLLLFAPSLLLLALALPASAADKLQAFYSGSGGVSAEVHRVVILEFAADGSAILQQTWQDKETQTWHARYTRDGKTITLTFTPEPNTSNASPAKPIEPLVFTFKHHTLTPTSWDMTALGLLGPPKLTPFTKTPLRSSVLTCHTLNTHNPTGQCTTWDSR